MKRYAAILLEFIFIVLVGLLIINIGSWGTERVFNSSDESSNYITMRLVAEDNRLDEYEEMSKFDKDNNLHPRGFLLYQGKIIPFNFLGIPLFYGYLYKFFGENIKYINLIYYLILVYATTYIVRQLGEKKEGLNLVSLIAVILNFPLLFYLNYPFYNISPGIVFWVLSLVFLIKYKTEKKEMFLYWSIAAATISLWFAYYWAIFYVVFYGIIFLMEQKKFEDYRKWGLSLLIPGIFFLVPLLLINKEYFGSYLNMGYSLFTKTFFYEERSSSIVKNIITFLLPSRKIDLNLLGINIKTSFLYLCPIFLISAFCGIVQIVKTNKKLIYFLPLIIWLLLYNGMSDTYLSGSEIVATSKAVVRYWLPIYYLLSIGFVYFLKEHNNRVNTIIVIFGSFVFFPIIFGELSDRNSQLKKYQETIWEYQEVVNQNDFILTPTEDKYLFNMAKPITWWMSYGDDKFFQAEKLNRLLENLLSNNKRVYIKKDNSLTYSRIEEITGTNLGAKRVMENLYQVVLK